MRLGFVFSLPRAGSTYTQRVLAGSKDVRTTSEPWLMPAVLGIRHGEPPLADFAYDHVRTGLSAMLADLPDGEDAWRRGVRAMAESLYGNFATGNQLFLDKTPRNAPFASEIMRTFPEARILFLWRNPLAVVNSINTTWGKGRWKTYFYEYDLYAGLTGLVDAYRAFRDDPRVLAVNYETLVSDPEAHWPTIFAHFGVEYAAEAVRRPPRMDFRMGDETGQARYGGTSAESVDSWRDGFGTWIRRRWARAYLREIGADRLADTGYDLAGLLAGIDSAPRRFRLSDYFLIPLSGFYHWFEPSVWRTRRGRGAKRWFGRR